MFIQRRTFGKLAAAGTVAGLAGRTPAMRVLSRLDVRPTKKYTSALS